MCEDQRGRMARTAPHLASFTHPFILPAEVDNYCGPGAVAGIKSTVVLSLARGPQRQARLILEAAQSAAHKCPLFPPGNFRTGPCWLLRPRSHKVLRARPSATAVDPRLTIYPRGTSNCGVIKSLSFPPVWNCSLTTPLHDSLGAIFLELFQIKWKSLVFLQLPA